MWTPWRSFRAAFAAWRDDEEILIRVCDVSPDAVTGVLAGDFNAGRAGDFCAAAREDLTDFAVTPGEAIICPGSAYLLEKMIPAP